MKWVYFVMIQKSALHEKTCCFTGHRQIPPDEWESVRARLEETIKQLYQRGIIYYGAGGALGFDTLAAETVLRLQKQKDYSKIKLILILPCYKLIDGKQEMLPSMKKSNAKQIRLYTFQRNIRKLVCMNATVIW